jgi:hypothetical protein
MEVEGRSQAVEEVPGERMGELFAGGSAMEQPQRKLRRSAGSSVLDNTRFLVTIDASNG